MSDLVKWPVFWTVSTVVAAAAIAAVSSGVVTAARAQAAASVWDGVYTTAQAERGGTVYKDRCLSCHGEKLDNGVAPAVIGEDFMADWEGRSVGDLFQRVQLTMPGDDPGKLMPTETADALAYIFSINKFPPGQKELPSDRDALKQIRILAKK